MMLVEVDGNYINAEPMKDRTARSMIKVYLALWNCLTATGAIKPATHLLDNEASAELKAEIKKLHNPICTSGQPRTNFSQTSNTNVQKSLQSDPGRSR